MSAINIKHKGDFANTEKILTRASSGDYMVNLNAFAERGVSALAEATPRLTGDTADSWSYKIEETSGYIKISWFNTELIDGAVPLAILLQYGHGTRNGGYVQGTDYINPAMQAIFDQIAKDAWEALIR